MPTLPDLLRSRTDLCESLTALVAEEASRRVLYIGDDPRMRGAWTGALILAGYSVTSADSPAAGLSAYVEQRFDGVFIAFHRLSVSSGVLATVMRLFRHSTPLILLSDSAASSDHELAPFDRVFPKNITPSVALGSLHGLIQRARPVIARQTLEFPTPPAGASERS